MRRIAWVALAAAGYLACSESDTIEAPPIGTGGGGMAPSSVVSTTGVTSVGSTTTSSSSGAGGNPECFNQCKNDHANGYIPYLTLVGCIYCGACYELCEAELPENMPSDPICNMGMETGCSAMFGSCDACTNDSAGF